MVIEKREKERIPAEKFANDILKERGVFSRNLEECAKRDRNWTAFVMDSNSTVSKSNCPPNKFPQYYVLIGSFVYTYTRDLFMTPDI